jgi:hypothetical protein
MEIEEEEGMVRYVEGTNGSEVTKWNFDAVSFMSSAQTFHVCCRQT